jgi:UDP-N-acetylmuramate dehydrogenase
MAESHTRLAQALSDVVGADNVRTNERVARYTTWRVGGPAALLCVVHDTHALARTVEFVRATSLPWLVLGRGSNVLVDDAGFDGVVILNRAAGLAIGPGARRSAIGDRVEAPLAPTASATGPGAGEPRQRRGESGCRAAAASGRLPPADVGVAVHAESGVLLSVLARQTAARGLVGLEWCHDIPGSLGGAVVNNAGANGGAIADVLRAVRVLPSVGQAHEVAASALSFAYRRSALRAEVAVPAGARPVVLDARFELQRGDAGQITQRMAAQRARRKATQPGGASAGSVFKNPPTDSAGRLVESVGLKGARCGEAHISTLHANFIVTGPRATAADVLALVALMRRRVRDHCGVDLEPEVQFVQRGGCIGPPPEDR